MSKRTWTDEEFVIAVVNSRSIRQVLQRLGLVTEGGNYVQVRAKIKELGLNTDHFLGMGWNVGLKFNPFPGQPIEELLVLGSHPQSHVLKNRLFKLHLKDPKCELCGWAETSIDGRIPVELDHINGNRNDNRIENLRILCPNCHSLQLTHRGKNKKVFK